MLPRYTPVDFAALWSPATRYRVWLDVILRLVHPIMPFVAESIWEKLNEAAFERGLPAPEPATESVVIAPRREYAAGARERGRLIFA